MGFEDDVSSMAEAIRQALGVPVEFRPRTGTGSFGSAVSLTAVRGPVEIVRDSPGGGGLADTGRGRAIESVTYMWPAADSIIAAEAKIGDAVDDSGVGGGGRRLISHVRRPGAGKIIEVETRRNI